MITSRKASAWFFGLFVVCAIVGVIARVVDISSRHAAHPAPAAGQATPKE